MRPLILSLIMLFICTPVFSMEKMGEPEMKDATAQASVAADLGGAVSPVSAIAGELGPVAAPVSPLMYIYDIVSPHVDPAAQLVEMNDTAAPVTRIVVVTGDVTLPFGLF